MSHKFCKATLSCGPVNWRYDAVVSRRPHRSGFAAHEKPGAPRDRAARPVLIANGQTAAPRVVRVLTYNTDHAEGMTGNSISPAWLDIIKSAEPISSRSRSRPGDREGFGCESAHRARAIDYDARGLWQGDGFSGRRLRSGRAIAAAPSERRASSVARPSRSRAAYRADR